MTVVPVLPLLSCGIIIIIICFPRLRLWSCSFPSFPSPSLLIMSVTSGSAAASVASSDIDCESCSRPFPRSDICPHNLCADCCRGAQITNGITCEHHLDQEVDGLLHQGRHPRLPPTRPSALRTVDQSYPNYKFLSVASPLLIFSPPSLVKYELKNPSAGVNLLQRKVDDWMTTHARFPEASEIRSLSKQVLQILGREHTIEDPVDTIDMLKEPLRRMMAIMYVRARAGYAGMKAFLDKTADEEEVPEEYQDALTASLAIGRRARANAREAENAAAAAAGPGDQTGGQQGGGGRGRGRGGRGGRYHARGAGRGAGGAGAGGAPAAAALPAVAGNGQTTQGTVTS